MQESLTINSLALVPLAQVNETQIIFQRHCNYDRTKGGLIPSSIEHQKVIISSFINYLSLSSKEELEHTYFLFTASDTLSSDNFKRCVETTDFAMYTISRFLKENNISSDHIMNLNEKLNYKNRVHEDKHLVEPKMFTDETGYLEYLKEKHGGINKNFWINFESDNSSKKERNFMQKVLTKLLKEVCII